MAYVNDCSCMLFVLCVSTLPVKIAAGALGQTHYHSNRDLLSRYGSGRALICFDSHISEGLDTQIKPESHSQGIHQTVDLHLGVRARRVQRSS